MCVIRYIKKRKLEKQISNTRRNWNPHAVEKDKNGKLVDRDVFPPEIIGTLPTFSILDDLPEFETVSEIALIVNGQPRKFINFFDSRDTKVYNGVLFFLPDKKKKVFPCIVVQEEEKKLKWTTASNYCLL